MINAKVDTLPFAHFCSLMGPDECHPFVMLPKPDMKGEKKKPGFQRKPGFFSYGR